MADDEVAQTDFLHNERTNGWCRCFTSLNLISESHVGKHLSQQVIEIMFKKKKKETRSSNTVNSCKYVEPSVSDREIHPMREISIL